MAKEREEMHFCQDEVSMVLAVLAAVPGIKVAVRCWCCRMGEVEHEHNGRREEVQRRESCDVAVSPSTEGVA